MEESKISSIKNLIGNSELSELEKKSLGEFLTSISSENLDEIDRLFRKDAGKIGGFWTKIKKRVIFMGESIALKLMEHIPEGKTVTVHQLTCRSGLDHRTIKKYLNLIMDIQEARRIVTEQVGLRVVVKKG